MRKPIKAEVLKTLRTRAGLSQQELADRSGLKKDCISRIERGVQSGATVRTQKGIANALKIRPEVLTGELTVPAPADTAVDRWLDSRRHQMNIRVDGAIRNAFALVALRYQVHISRIVELAPFLFVVAAERSLEQRHVQLKELGEAHDRTDAAAAAFSHLPRTIGTNAEAFDAFHAEQESVANRDILAARLDDDLFGLWGPQKRDYDPEQDNPFVSYLREQATDPAVAEITSFSDDDMNFRVCLADAKRLAGGEVDLAAGILDGWAPLHEMPRDLLKEEALEGRLAWLRNKAAEHEAFTAQLLVELDALVDGDTAT